MSLTGELSDLSLAELIEFFCNQRKTGRLDVLYPDGPAHFYLQSGNVAHAEIGALRGIEAVYYALTLANASFTFNSASALPQQTINQPWTSVVLEGLRRMDEGTAPPDPFPPQYHASVAEKEPQPPAVEEKFHEPVPEAELQPPVVEEKFHEPVVDQNLVEATEEKSEPHDDVIDLEPARLPHANQAPPIRTSPQFLEIQSSGAFSYGPRRLGAIFGAVALVIAVIALPWGWYARSKARLNAESPTVTTDRPQPTEAVNSISNPQPETTSSPSVTPAEQGVAANESVATKPTNVDAEKKAREARLREDARLKMKTAESTTNSVDPQPAEVRSMPQPTREQSPQASTSKRVTVQVTYDENGRVTQASGGDATALRIARQKRFPAGKAGSATITIPIN